MKIMFLICISILIFAIFTYDKWSYKVWYKEGFEKGGYDCDGNYYDHKNGLVYYKDGCVEKIDYQNLNKNRKKHKQERDINEKKMENS